ncbi:MAG: peptidoglycan recognition family protein [Polyangiaceae bacterium]
MAKSSLAWLLALVVVGCAPAKTPGARERMVAEAADAAGVPTDLMLAVAHIEGGLRLADQREVHPDDLVEVAGVLELRHGAFDSLARGAELTHHTEAELSADLTLGTHAGALVLAELGHTDGATLDSPLEAWASAIERLSGHRTEAQRQDYRARVFSLLRTGGTLRARGGERIELAPHPEIPASLTMVPPGVKTQGGTPDYALAEWIPTSCTDKCNTTRNASIEMIAIHDTEGGWDASVATLQNDPGKSVHYIVDADGGRVGQFIPESYDGWHVGNSYYNNRMVGIENVGYAGVDDYQTALYETTAALVKDIASRNAIPLGRSHVVAHQEVPDGANIPQSSPPCPDSPGTCIASGNYGGANHHSDPGVYWEWCQFMELAGGTCKCNDTFELWNCVHDLSMMNRCVDGNVEIVHCADPCVVEPIGIDDHCTPIEEGTGGALNGAGGALNGAGGAMGGSGGAGGDGGGSNMTPNGEDDADCGCREAPGAPTPPGLAALGALAAALILKRRRPR